MSQAYPAYPPPKASSDLNVPGLISLIMSILGLFTFLFAPVGLLFSLVGTVLGLFGLRHPQKGLAIGGLIVGIVGTIINGTIVAIFVIYFGAVGSMCCFAVNAAQSQIEQEAAAKEAVATALSKSKDEITIHDFYVPSFESNPEASGVAVYADEMGTNKAVDFTATFEKVDGKWTATVTIDSEPRDWVDFPDYEDEYEDENSTDESMLEQVVVPLANQELPADHVLTEADFTMTTMTKGDMHERGLPLELVMMSSADLVGRTLRNPVHSGDPFLTTDVKLDEGTSGEETGDDPFSETP